MKINRETAYNFLDMLADAYTSFRYEAPDNDKELTELAREAVDFVSACGADLLTTLGLEFMEDEENGNC